jgi:hypothetical protein
MRYVNDEIISGEDVAENQESIAIDASYLFQVSVQANISGTTPAGTLKIQCSNDKIVASNLAANTVPVNWSDIPDADVAVTDEGSFVIPRTELSYQWIRLVWTASSGTGAITANIMAVGQ